MSKIKQAIETAVAQINIASRNTYGAKIYTFEQVTLILDDLLETLSEDGSEETQSVTITQEQIDELIESIEQRIDGNINKMDTNDIVDEDSIEITLSGGRYTVDNIDANTDNIVTEAQYGIDDVVTGWALTNNLIAE
jgi:TolA-binding protein